MAQYKQSTTYTRTFLMVLTSDHLTGATGKSPTVNLSKAGGAFGAAAGTVSEIANGWYKIALTTVDTGTLGDLTFDCTAAACDNTDFADQITADVDQTGDSYARLGAPAGASISADIAEIEVETDAIGTSTSGLTFTVANQVDVNVKDWAGTAVAATNLAGVPVVDPSYVLRRNTAQAGAASTITLDAGANATDNYYRGSKIALISATGAGQARIITGYVGATKVATVSPAWITNPDVTTVFEILPIGSVNVEAWESVAPNVLISGRVDASVGSYPGNTAQTGDSFARLGAPAGASIAADLAEIEGETDTIGTSTSGLTFTVANQVDVNVLDWKSATAPAMTGDAYARLGAPAGATIAADINTIDVETDAIIATLGTPAGASLAADLAEIEGETDTLVTGVVVTTNNDKTGYSIGAGGIINTSFAANTGLVPIRTGTAQAGASGTITLDAGASATDSFYVGLHVLLTGATGAGQVRVITAYVGATKVATVDWNWVTNPDVTSTFALLQADGPAVSSAMQVATSASDPWGTALPGAYGAGTAGNIVGNNVNASISAVKTQTDKLAFTVANQVDANVLDWKSSTAPAMTGDAFARLGAPVGATISADIAEVEGETDTLVTGVVVTTNNDKSGYSLTQTFPANFSSLSIDGSGNIKIQTGFKKNTALAKFQFMMTDSVNHNPVTGKVVTCTRMIDGSAFLAGTLANVAEATNGYYLVDFGAGDLNGNVITLRATAAGCDDTGITLVTAP
jgi:hypothetical protein